MEYWIIVDKRHAGPYSADQLVNAGLRTDTLVWCEGLPEWTPAGEIRELAELMAMRDNTQPRPQPEEPRDNRPLEEAPYGNAQPAQPSYEPSPAYAPQQAPYTPASPAATAPEEPCPPAYIAWSVIATLLCCTIAGIPAIIFSSMTKSAYYKGDIAKARRYSEWAQWCIILAITLGAVSWPFQMAFMGAF